MRKNKLRVALGLAIVLMLLAHVADRLRVPFIDSLESIIYDARLRLTMPRTQDSRIVILDIDEKSLVEPERGGEGHWPWPRDRLALLLDKLFDHYQIAAVGFDVVFAESDQSSGLRVLEKLGAEELKSVPQFQSAFAELRPRLDYDQLFAESMKNRTVVLGFTFLSDPAVKGAIPSPVLTAADFGPHPPPTEEYAGYTGNLPVFQKNAAAAGHFNPTVDSDGMTRRVPMLAKYKDGYFEPLALAIVRLIVGSPRIQPDIADTFSSAEQIASLDAIRVGPYTIPLDGRGAALVPYRGPQGSFAYHSLVDVLNNRVDVNELRGKIALVGASAPGLLDLRATPVDRAYPGVEIHANLIAGMLDQNIKHTPPYAIGAEFVFVLLVGLAMAIWLPMLAPQPALLVTLSLLLLAVGVNLSLFQYVHVVLPLATGLVLILLLFTLNMAL